MSEPVEYRGQNDAKVGALRARLEGVVIRLATAEDLLWIDGLQKKNGKGVGFQFWKALETRVAKGDIILAELPDGERLGYLLGVDRYHKRDDVGIIYQICVEKKYRGSLVAGALLQAQFDKSAYGVRLYCCWCAQDLAANRFWEAMGFVPIAFRTGSEKNKVKGPDGKVSPGPRMHIFWQKRVRAGDTGDGGEGGTGWWFPSETQGGAMGANRVVLPIPPGTRWYDAKPVVLPPDLAALPGPEDFEVSDEEIAEFLEEEADGFEDGEVEGEDGVEAIEDVVSVTASGGGGGLRFGPSAEELATEAAARETAAKAALKEKKKAVRKATKKAQKRRARKYDPRLLAFSRELRDRWQEEVAVNPGLLLGVAEEGKYDVRRLVGPAGLPPEMMGRVGVEVEGGGEVIKVDRVEVKLLPRAA